MMGWICPICGKARPPQRDECCSAPLAQTSNAPAQKVAQTTGAVAQNGDAPRFADVVALERKNRTTARKRQSYDDPSFDEFWSAYPLNLDKRKAFGAWRNALAQGAVAHDVIAGANRYARWVSVNAIEPRHVKYAQGWLNDERWNDELKLPAAVGDLDPATVVGTPEYQARQIAEGVW